MKKGLRQVFFRFLAVFLIMLLAGISVIFMETAGRAAEERTVPKTAAVIVSRKIRPYLEAVEGLNAGLSKESNTCIDIHYLDKYQGKSRTILKEKLLQSGFDIYIAVGPEATRFVWQNLQVNHSSCLYCMVLNPEKIIDSSQSFCGIPLSVSAWIQIQEVIRKLPSVDRLGLLFDPTYNGAFFRDALACADAFNLEIIPLEVTSKKDIPIALKENWKKINGLWLIPDQTVISESIVKYIIKESVFQKIPVIGYNRFFFESGAALSFIFDYKRIGEQTAELALRILEGEKPQTGVPFYEPRLNFKVMQVIGLDANTNKNPLSRLIP